MDNRDFKTICMTEDYWATSPFSLARHFGRIKVGGHVYVIVNKEGKDIFQLSFEAEKAGREMASSLESLRTSAARTSSGTTASSDATGS